MGKEKKKPEGSYRLYRAGEHPKPKKDFIPNTFMTRKSAKHYCKGRPFDKWTIVHPDGTEESYPTVDNT